jgi:hypothetical protein
MPRRSKTSARCRPAPHAVTKRYRRPPLAAVALLARRRCVAAEASMTLHPSIRSVQFYCLYPSHFGRTKRSQPAKMGRMAEAQRRLLEVSHPSPFLASSASVLASSNFPSRGILYSIPSRTQGDHYTYPRNHPDALAPLWNVSLVLMLRSQQMMGAEAMGITQQNVDWWDEKVCRNYLFGTCPHVLFGNTVSVECRVSSLCESSRVEA